MDSIIFDLDGTIWDSRQTIVRAWNQVLTQYDEVNKEVTEDDLKRVMGLQEDEISEILFPELSKEKRKEIMVACGKQENAVLAEKGGELYDGVEEILQHLSEKYKLFIVSNCQDGYIESFYAFHQVEKYFIDFENPGRTGLSKGENIKLVMERNQLESPIYVGDTAGDQKASEVAGIPFAYASYGFGTVEKYDYKLERFADLKRFL
ncbi:5'-methylthioadenosine nucleosidase [Bacillus sp. JCM 19046]|uniref:Phosphoglycolate phosphatase n=1 Tax=Shouchella xiaoxiensis TaxID=766895 RepID=A0ABS2SWF9_9BACI|nr:HAD family hydrolase [Shouchella xiaoxiensis]MBM7839336.1 phosphoglycolate phosphatase [Shouchella xiaoxiensis]GAF12965.1 5'-methylthioadenosine nucleosidase [Bacillus sp. JCM 19045]GAF15618.1 5'-methylthioadenosine nucleosidase [Bacillus sp. JCM 19046]